MSLKPLMCPQCGGQIDNFDESMKKGICPYCDAIIEDVQDKQQQFQTNSQGAVKVSQSDFIIEAGVLKAYHGESRDVVVPNNVYSISEEAFDNLPITTIKLPSSLKQICLKKFTYNYIPTLKSIEVESENTLYTSKNGILYNKSMSTLLLIPAGIDCIPSEIIENINISNEVPDAYNSLINFINDDCYSYKINNNIITRNGSKLIVKTNGSGKLVLDNDEKSNRWLCWCLPSFKDTNIKNIIFEEGITEIDGYFDDYASLESITLPSTIKRIACPSFLASQNLNEVHYRGETPKLDLERLLFFEKKLEKLSPVYSNWKNYQSKMWESQGLCPYCGKNLKGVFKKYCTTYYCCPNFK